MLLIFWGVFLSYYRKNYVKFGRNYARWHSFTSFFGTLLLGVLTHFKTTHNAIFSKKMMKMMELCGGMKINPSPKQCGFLLEFILYHIIYTNLYSS